MALYCGIDLRSTNNYISVLDENDKPLFEKRMPNDLERGLLALAPYQDELQGVVVESTYNWYWLVDGLIEAGFNVHFANTNAMRQYDGIKYTDDLSDVRFLAHLLRQKADRYCLQWNKASLLTRSLYLCCVITTYCVEEGQGPGWVFVDSPGISK